MSAHPHERTNAAVAFVGLGVVLVVSPLSTLITAAVVITMVCVAALVVLTSNPVQVVRSRSADRDRAADGAPADRR